MIRWFLMAVATLAVGVAQADGYLRLDKDFSPTNIVEGATVSPFAGKKIAFIGDSYVQNHRRPITETWHCRLAEKFGMHYYNYGRNGNCIVFANPRRGAPIAKRFGEIPRDVDYLVVIAGHNDACDIAQLGGQHSIPDPTAEQQAEQMKRLAEFKAGLAGFIDGLRKRYPRATLVFVTPWAVERPFFAEVIAAIKEETAKAGVACYDAASLSDIDPNDADFRKRYFQGEKDTAHLTYEGHGLMLEKMEGFFGQLQGPVDAFARVAIYERLRKETKVSVEETAEGWRIKVTSGVRLRGVFINDEDWGLRPWAVKHFGKDEQIGTNTYAEVFALMRANGLNLLWPAMHEGGYEFSSRPENFELADRYGITIGTSHCEPMLRNNCYLPRSDQKKWSWLTNRDFITGYWREGVRRGDGHNVMYTLGMRGIHDGRMSDGTNTAQKVAILEEVFTVQKGLLPSSNSNSTTPTLFCPYKEVLPIFNAGLKVPDETTIMWVNDNFGYIRRLGGPQVEGRPQGIYYHASYHGHPHGYIHLCTTPPALLWYELCAKAWNNGVRDVWMLNAGDVFQAELLLSCYGKLAGNPEGYGPAAQDELLAQAVSEKLNVKSEELQGRIVAHLNEYYSLGFNRKPEHMCIQWTTNLPQTVKAELLGRYKAFLAEDLEIERQLSSSSLDLYYRLIGFQAQFLAQAGIIHLEGRDKSYARSVIDPLYERWNNLEDGKWAGFWCDTIDENGGMRQPTTSNRWSSQMQWPWNEPADPYKKDRKGTSRSQYTATAYRANVPEPTWLEPISSTPANGGAWTRVTGLGTSGRAHALLPVKPGVGKGASLVFSLSTTDFRRPTFGGRELVLQFLPDFALWPGLKLGVNVRFDDGAVQYVAVPKSDSNLGEKDPVRAVAVQDNFIRVAVPIPAGAKRVEILATDPGVVLDRVGVR